MAKKYGVASDYIKYTSRIKSDTSDGVAVEASQVVDLEEDKLQSDINKELKASIASASGNTYSKSEIDGKDTATLTSAKSYADTKKTEAVSAAATDATTKANSALASAKSYADQKVSALGSVYTTKGSCTAAQLKALTSAKAGDVWNITDAVTIDGKAYPAGVNVVCVTAFSAAIDPATTKNWDALQGVQDLTPYAKKSEIESEAIANVKFTQEELGQENGVSFKKTITYVNGRETDTDFGLAIDPATSSKAGVMSAADKVKLDAVDGKIQGVNVSFDTSNSEFIIREGDEPGDLSAKTVMLRDGVHIYNDVHIGTGVDIGKNSQIGTNSLIKESVSINSNTNVGRNTLIGTGVEIDDYFKIGSVVNGEDVRIDIHIGDDSRKKVLLDNDLTIGSSIILDGAYDIVGLTIGSSTKGFGINKSGDFVWGVNGTVQTAATADSFSLMNNNLSALETRVSALEDLLKLA